MLHDVAIVGAGPVGATLALALADADLDVVVLDARSQGETLRGDRSLALSHGARLIFERLGVWRILAATDAAVTPIVKIDISQARGFGRAMLDASEYDLPALGYVVSYRALQSALDRSLSHTAITVSYGVTARKVGGTSAYAAIETEDRNKGKADCVVRLAAVADGTGATVAGMSRQRHEYGQVAVIAKLWREAPHQGRAYERFTSEGPLALLPEGDHYGLVWTTTAAGAESLLALDDAPFLAALERHFGTEAGRFDRVSDRRTFPLLMEYARRPATAHCVMLGNAAQTLHPVAGQGFNIGLRDAWQLAQVTIDTPRDEIGGRAMLDRYLDARRADRVAGIAFTHGLVGVFGNDWPLLRWPRGLALTILDAMPPVKRAFTHAMLFGIH